MKTDMNKFYPLFVGASVRVFVTFTAAVTLSSCSLPQSSSTASLKETQDRQKLISTYSQFRGTYRGTMQTADQGSVEVEVRLDTREAANGYNSDGQPRYIPTLTALYRRLDIIEPDQILEGRLMDDSQMIFTNGKKDRDYFELNLRAQGPVLVGSAKPAVGLMGGLRLQQISTEVQSLSMGVDTEYQQRLQNFYLQLAGIYEGTLKTNSGIVKAFQIQLKYNSFGSTQNPELEGRLRFLLDQDGIAEKSFKVLVKPQFKPTQIEFQSNGDIGNVTDAKYLNFRGVIEKGALSGYFETKLEAGTLSANLKR